MTYGEHFIGINDDDILGAYIFLMEMIPRWSKNMMSLITIGTLQILEKKMPPIKLIKKLVLYVLARQINQRNINNVLHLCIKPHK